MKQARALGIILVVFLGACRSVGHKVAESASPPEPPNDDRALALSGLMQKNGWLDSDDIDLGVEHLQSKTKGAIRAYARGAYGASDQSEITMGLRADIRQQWISGSSGYRYKFPAGLGNIDYHYFPVNLGNISRDNGGSHWTGIIVDSKRGSIEYYDSLGKSPPIYIQKRLEAIRDEFALLEQRDFEIKVVDLGRHQVDNFNCGVFSLYYAHLKASGLSADDIAIRDFSDIAAIREKFRIDLYGSDNKTGFAAEYKSRPSNPAPQMSPIQRAYDLRINDALSFEDGNFARELRNMGFDAYAMRLETDPDFADKVNDYEKAADYVKQKISDGYKPRTPVTADEYGQIIKKYSLKGVLPAETLPTEPQLARVGQSSLEARAKAFPTYAPAGSKSSGGFDKAFTVVGAGIFVYAILSNSN